MPPSLAMAADSQHVYVGYVVATETGSLPMGGWVQDSPVHALKATPPELLAAMRAPLPATRTDIDIGEQLAFVIDNVISKEAAQAWIAIGEHFGFREDAPGIRTPPGMRMNQAMHWMAERALMEQVYAAIGPLLPREIDGKKLWPRLSERIDMYKYRKGDVFRRHIDGTWPGYGIAPDGSGIATWPNSKSELSMLLYLNGDEDGVQGGATRLYARNGREVDVVPRSGSALFFRHGFTLGSVMHAGLELTGEQPKYVARINVLYDEQ